MIDVVPMERNEESFEFALAVKKEAFGPHIMERWGWDERRQRETHAERWAEKRFFRIVRDRESIGVVSIDPRAFVAQLTDRDAKGPPVVLPDGTTARRLPGY